MQAGGGAAGVTYVSPPQQVHTPAAQRTGGEASSGQAADRHAGQQAGGDANEREQNQVVRELHTLLKSTC